MNDLIRTIATSFIVTPSTATFPGAESTFSTEEG
jgi:hypothetical protein